ncbi:beta-galactosidase [Clostridium sp. 19966]|uniref:beta-galactosidase n=1 Tax=Clostridium sp. 19966 TaxID=2768166 RepID=UPI0028E4A513|nr:beta-galactosidase [Clostridium sp. 19966]
MIKIGVDYYPEHWDAALWEQDADLMKETGVKLVRLAEFAWSKLSPSEGSYEFEWLDNIISIFEKRGIDIILCTPTSTPPLWLYQKYPETIQVGRDGNKIALGIRGHRCYNSKLYRKYAEDIIEKLTTRYSQRPSVVAWQIDNEVESNFCCCEECTDKFRNWVKNKYGTIENVNKAYGNNVWSGEYSDWNQIIPPLGSYPYTWYNVAYMLDFHRYASESITEYVNFQMNIIRKNCPSTKITTNTWMCENFPDYHDLFRNLDFVSYDNYPATSIPDDKEAYYSHAFHLDLMRGVKQKNFWIMEQLSGTPGGWMPMQPTPKPGMIKGYSMQAIARGADAVIHFRWRSAISGAEMFWHGLIDHSNVPGRRFKEFAELCAEVNQMEDLSESQIINQCAIIYTFEQDCALKIQPQSDGFHYYQQLKAFHHAFTSMGVGVDIVNDSIDLSKYKIVVLPTMYIVNPDFTKKVYEFVENGGIVLLTNRSGVKDLNNNCIMEQLPTVFSDLTGCVVEEYDAIGSRYTNVKGINNNIYKCTKWCDILEEKGAEVLATYDDNFYKGRAAVTINQYGKGYAYYLGTVGDKAFYKDFLQESLKRANISYVSNLPDNVEISIRRKNNIDYLFIFNNTEKSVTFQYKEMNLELEPFKMILEKFN